MKLRLIRQSRKRIAAMCRKQKCILWMEGISRWTRRRTKLRRS